jgi:hypothetical protein
MAKVTLQNSLPAIGAGYLGIFWLCLLLDAMSNSFLAGLGTFLISVPIIGTLLGLLVVEAVVCFEIPSDRANEWWHYAHETTGGALVIAILSLPWLMAVASLGLLGLMSFWVGGGGLFTTPLNWIAKIPILGPFVALVLSLSFIGVYLGLFGYVAYTAFDAVMRLIRAPRTGFVENGVPIDGGQRNLAHQDNIEDGEFGGWESNRG